MITLTQLRVVVNRLQGSRADVLRDCRAAVDAHSRAASALAITDAARALLQRTALLTQQQLRYHVTALGTMAMEAVFPDPVALDLQFRENRGKTEARLLFERDGHLLDPLDEDSGGACNIAGLGLRASMREAQRPRTRPIIVMDEPGRDLNDPDRIMHAKFAEMIREVSGKLGVQFLLVSMVEELVEAGERVGINAK